MILQPSPISSPATCLICNGEVTLHAVQGIYRYWKCTRCKTAQLLPQPHPEALTDYYCSYHESSGEYVNYEGRMQADFPAKARIVRTLVPEAGARLLDVGCGKGYFLREVAATGLRAEGIDLSFSAIEFARRDLGVSAVVGRLEANRPAEWSQAFDIATSWATIEHLPNPLAVLKAINECLKPGGILILDTGLGHAPFERWLAGHSQWYEAPQHLFVHSEPGLKILLEKAGFRLIFVDRNFERTLLRRLAKWLRHSALCIASYSLLRPGLGGPGFRQLQRDAKWPLGRLIQVRAQKASNPR